MQPEQAIVESQLSCISGQLVWQFFTAKQALRGHSEAWSRSKRGHHDKFGLVAELDVQEELT